MANKLFGSKYIATVMQRLKDLGESDGAHAEVIAIGAGIDIGIASGTFQRPNDTTAYAVNDVVGVSPAALITFENLARQNGGSGFISMIRLIKSTNVVTNAAFRLYLYSVAPTAVADNAQWPMLWANRANRLGWVDLVCESAGTGSDSAGAIATAVNLAFSCGADTRNIYGVLVATAAYTPGAQESFHIEIKADNN